MHLKNDPLLFPALKNSPNAELELERLQSSITDSTIKSVGRHGKHFWLRLQPPNSTNTNVMLMHFGMTGMVKIRNIKSHLVFMENGGDKKILEKKLKESETKSIKVEGAVQSENAIDVVDDEEAEWPPRFVKLEFDLTDGDKKLEFAFVDPRRLGRIRLLSGDSVQTDEQLLQNEPLSKLGPDYSKPVERIKQEDGEFEFGDPDPDHHGRPRLSLAEFNKLVLSKKKPIKALLQEQEYFSGVGNWVSDEIVYQARIHPAEVLSSKLTYDPLSVDPIISKLYESLIYVVEESVRIEGDVTKFPDHWLMLFRWSKGRKNSPKVKTNDGYEVDHITVGGRTSCFVPKLQKMLPAPKKRPADRTEKEEKVQTKKRNTKK